MWSLWSENSVLSICSQDSVLSIGSAASIASFASVGSFASAGSIGSAMSAASLLSYQSAGSALSRQSNGSMFSSQANRAFLGRQTHGGVPAGMVAAGALATLAAIALPRNPKIFPPSTTARGLDKLDRRRSPPCAHPHLNQRSPQRTAAP